MTPMRAGPLRLVKLFLRRRFTASAKIYRDLRDSRALRAEPVMTPQGFRFIGNVAMQNGTFEQEETGLVDRLLRNVDVLVNVGANIGYYCCMALQAGRDVVAFEPIDLNVQYLLKNLKANGWQDSAEVYPIAVTSGVGLIEIYGAGSGASTVEGWAGTPSADVRLVPASTLDLVLGERFLGKRCLVVVDIEGAELGMLRGATMMLTASPKPVWMVEISIDEHQPAGTPVNPNLVPTFQLFLDHGYEAWTAEHRPRAVTMEEVSRVAATAVNSFGTHNFLFIERGARDKVLGDAQRS
jgi:FkbM family methyltransferase